MAASPSPLLSASRATGAETTSANECGDDWRGIERDVNERVSRLPREKQEVLRHEAFMMLRFEPPQRRRS